MIFSKKQKKGTKTPNQNSRKNVKNRSQKTAERSSDITPPLTAQTKDDTPMTKPVATPSPKKPGIPSFNASRFSSPAMGASSDTRKLTVGKDISLSGEIGACDHLVVEGTVEATIKGGQSLEITETGLFKGTVEIDNAIIAGRFEGNLVVKGHLVIRSTGSVSGDIHYGDLAIDAGASVNGTIECVGLPQVEQSEDEKRVGSVKPVFRTTVANQDDQLHEEESISPAFTANML